MHVQSLGREQWFQIQDLIVEEILPQMIFLSESYLQVSATVFGECVLLILSKNLDLRVYRYGSNSPNRWSLSRQTPIKAS